MNESCFNCRHVRVETEMVAPHTTGAVNFCKLTGQETTQDEDFHGCPNYEATFTMAIAEWLRRVGL